MLCWFVCVIALRGIGAGHIFLEEFVYIKVEILKDIVFPLATVSRTCIFAISSPKDADNFASALTDAVDPKTGEKIFVTIRANCCLACVRKSVKVCTHTRKRLPDQIAQKSLRCAQALMGSDSVKNQQELQGIEAGSREYMMRPYLEALRTRETLTLGNQDLVFTFVDPSPGCTPSDFAILSIVRLKEDPPREVVIGFDIHQGDGSGKHLMKGTELILNHYRRLMNQNPSTRAARFVLIPEAQLHRDVVGMYCEKVLEFFQEQNASNRIYIEQTMAKPKPYYGVPKNEQMTWDMCIKTRDMLSNNLISFASYLSSSDAIAQKALMIKQLGAYYFQPKALEAGEKEKYLVRNTGRDDLALCLMSCIYHEESIRRSERFERWCRSLGLAVDEYRPTYLTNKRVHYSR